jgi:hypothetical protein
MTVPPVPTFDLSQRLNPGDMQFTMLYADALELFRKAEESYRSNLDRFLVLMPSAAGASSPGVEAKERAVRMSEDLADLVRRGESLNT